GRERAAFMQAPQSCQHGGGELYCNLMVHAPGARPESALPTRLPHVLRQGTERNVLERWRSDDQKFPSLQTAYNLAEKQPAEIDRLAESEAPSLELVARAKETVDLPGKSLNLGPGCRQLVAGKRG